LPCLAGTNPVKFRCLQVPDGLSTPKTLRLMPS
jgi:hypothetical protein